MESENLIELEEYTPDLIKVKKIENEYV